MKNLLVYIHPSKVFNKEGKTAIKIQLDNSLSLGWKKKDILLVTNFPYEYRGIKSLVIKDDNYCASCPTASKIYAIADLFAQNLIKKDEIYWFHDLDAYELYRITKSELEFDKADLMIPDFGRLSRWATGSFFFKDGSRNIFDWIKDLIVKFDVNEEDALLILTRRETLAYHDLVKGYASKDLPKISNINIRINKANITYNFHSFNVQSNYANALKPIKVAHFHFVKRLGNRRNPRPDQVEFFLYGRNKLGIQLVPNRLVKIFHRHGIR